MADRGSTPLFPDDEQIEVAGRLRDDRPSSAEDEAIEEEVLVLPWLSDG